jgi:hypothetical protein
MKQNVPGLSGSMAHNGNAVVQNEWYAAASSFMEWFTQLNGADGAALAPSSANAPNRRLRMVRDDRGFPGWSITP